MTGRTAHRRWRSLRRATVALFAAAACWPAAADGFSVPIGDLLPAPSLATLDGRTEPLLSPAAGANVFVFVRPGQQHSTDALRQLAALKKELEGKPIHWVAVVSSTWARDDVRRTLSEAGIAVPVLIDEGDALQGRLGVRLHPALGVADARFRLLAYEPFRSIQWSDRVRAEIRHALGEISAAAVAAVDDPARARQPNEIPGAVARRHVHMAEGYLRMKMYEKAAAEARHALELEPGLPAAQTVLDEALAAQRQ